ncbi:hypothetical protein BGX20_004062 [Mortierella sp. AD010]|nr:hypothetical protein BGX20_004062 [Mortierella sp. AD010]
MAEEMSGKSETGGNANETDISELEALKESLGPLFLRKLSMVTIKIQRTINCRVTERLNRIMEEECSEAIRENAKTTGLRAAATTQDVQRILEERKPNVERVIREDVLDEYGIGVTEFAKLEAIAEPVPSRLKLSRPLRALRGVQTRIPLATLRSPSYQLPMVTISKICSQTRIANKAKFPNDFLNPSASRSFTKSCIRSDSDHDHDHSGNNNNDNGSNDGDDICRSKNGTKGSVKARPPVEISDAVDFIRGRIIIRSGGRWLVEEIKDRIDLEDPIWSHYDASRIFMNCAGDLFLYPVMDEVEVTDLEEFGLSREEYYDLLGPQEVRDATYGCLGDPEQIKKVIEFWRQERREKQEK